MQPPLEYLHGNITVEATWGRILVRRQIPQDKMTEKHTNLLHGEVPDVSSKLASACGTAGELRPAVGADQVARVALGRERVNVEERF